MKPLLLLLTTLPLLVTSAPAGVAAAVDTLLVKNVKNYLMPMILRTVNELPIPRVDFDGGHADNFNLDLFIANNDSIALQFSE